MEDRTNRLQADETTRQRFHELPAECIPSEDPKEERVYMTAASLDGTEDFYLVPLAEVEQREAQGWNLWKCPKPSLDDKGEDKRQCSFPQDFITNNRPHEDFEFYFPPKIVDCIKQTAAPPSWKPGMPLEQGYDEEDNISTAEKFCPPSQWKQVVTGSSNGHFPTIRIPKGIGLGWGDYDLFTG